MIDQSFAIRINGVEVRVRAGTSVASAILQAGDGSRVSVMGQVRQPFCGMGICYECRAEIDGRPHQKTCQIFCRDGMQVHTR